MGKEELLKFKKLLELDIEFIEQKIDLERQIKRTSIITLLMGILTLFVIVFTSNYSRNITVYNVIFISIIVTGITTQVGDIVSSSRNIDFFKFEYEHKRNQLKKIIDVLEKIE